MGKGSIGGRYRFASGSAAAVNHLQQKTKAYLRVPEACGLVWFELDLAENKGDNSIKVRRMQWVAPRQGKPLCTAVSVGSSIYLLGGQTIMGLDQLLTSFIPHPPEYHADVFYFDATDLFGANQLKVAPSMFKGHRNSKRNVVVHQGKIYVLSDQGEFFNPESNSWNRFQGPPFDPDLKCFVRSYSDPLKQPYSRLFRCMQKGYRIPPYEYRPNHPSSWTCLDPRFNPPSGIEVSALVDDIIISHRCYSLDFVDYDLSQRKWSTVEWVSQDKFDPGFFKECQFWRALLHLGNRTLLMARDMPHCKIGCRDFDRNKIVVDCLVCEF